MNKKTFIKAIKALRTQIRHDQKQAQQLAQVFPDAHPGNLMPDNHFVSNMLIEVLQEAMHDTQPLSWIEYFCFELDFGKENWRLKAYHEGKEIPMATPGQLYNFLVKNSKIQKK